MKILITGGCGFLGSNLASYGAELGYDIMLFDNLSRLGSEQNKDWLLSQGNIQFCFGDIIDAEQVQIIFSKFSPDIVFHLAGQVAMTTSIRSPMLDMQTNVIGTLNVLECARKKNNNTKIIFSSTNKVYGDLEGFEYQVVNKRYECSAFENGVSEKVPLDFRSPYGCSKGAADQYVLDYNRIYGLETVVFRHSSMYGGRQYPTEDQGWVGWFCSEVNRISLGEKQNKIIISGNGFQVRDLLNSEDMCKLYFNALSVMPQISGQAFNIGGGIENSLSLLELLEFLSEYFSVDIEIDRKETRQSDQKIFIADLTKIKKSVNWSPQKPFEDGLAEYIKWIRHEH